MPAEGRTVSVDRLRPGDHAFLGYADDEARWDVLRAFTQQGLARDEKVFVLADVGYSTAWVASRVAGGTAAARRALRAGQLVVSSTPRFARGNFDAGRLVEGARRRIDTVLAEGFSGLRSASEMSLALAPVDHLGQAVEFEAALHAELFTDEAHARPYTALCYWDERVFGGTAAMDAVRDLHPMIVLPALGSLRTTTTPDGIAIAGDADLASREPFEAALRELGGVTAATVVLDITGLSFFDASSAAAVLRVAAGLGPPRRLEVRCRRAHRRLLQLLGGSSIGQLSIITERS